VHAWQDLRVSSIEDRYDRIADRYERWWAPVLAPTARGLADELTSVVDRVPDARLVDIGTGTGTLAIELVRRFPAVTVTAVDSSAAMLDEARQQATRALTPSAVRRLEFVRGDAEKLPLPSVAFDAAVSSFVFQLVANRAAAFREARRVLRPDGFLAVVTWLASDAPFEPDEALEDAIDELRCDFEDEEDDGRTGNFASSEAAATQARRAGFRDATARRHDLVHRYDPARYLEFLETYAEQALFDGLDGRDRERLRAETQRRLDRLAPDEFVWRAPVVTLTARRNR
jgi:ubiquinone/menaquinone biosynthesis C-methylase UbiE